MLKILVTGGDGRFAKELEKLEADINSYLEIKNSLIYYPLNQLKIILKNLIQILFYI